MPSTIKGQGRSSNTIKSLLLLQKARNNGKEIVVADATD
jgi:hypothetical protein